MDRNGRLVGIILAILIFANVSDASFLSKLRELAALNSPRNSDVVSVPPSPSPDSLKSDSSSKNPKVPVPVPENKRSNNTVKQAPPPLSQKDDGKNGEADKRKKNKNKDQDLQPEVSKNCTGVPRRCVQKSWIACILNFETDACCAGCFCPLMADLLRPFLLGMDQSFKHSYHLIYFIGRLKSGMHLCPSNSFQTHPLPVIHRFTKYKGSKELVILVENEGEGPLRVYLSAPNASDNPLVELPKKKSKKINLKAGNHTGIILKAGNGTCVLQLKPPVSQGNFYVQLPSFEKLMTPINGAYFMIFTVIVFGGTWACCLFRKRRRQDGIPYQELEMGVTESGVVNDVESAEGWDQGWDDDWEEGSAVKSPVAHNVVGNISANGLTSRSPNRDGWENNWDD